MHLLTLGQCNGDCSTCNLTVTDVDVNFNQCQVQYSEDRLRCEWNRSCVLGETNLLMNSCFFRFNLGRLKERIWGWYILAFAMEPQVIPARLVRFTSLSCIGIRFGWLRSSFKHCTNSRIGEQNCIQEIVYDISTPEGKECGGDAVWAGLLVSDGKQKLKTNLQYFFYVWSVKCTCV